MFATSMLSSRSLQAWFMKVVRLPRGSLAARSMRVWGIALVLRLFSVHGGRCDLELVGHQPGNDRRSSAPTQRDLAPAVAAADVLVPVSGDEDQPGCVSWRTSPAGGPLLTERDPRSGLGARGANPAGVFVGLRAGLAQVPGTGRGSAHGGTVLSRSAGPVALEAVEGPRDSSAVGWDSVIA